MDSRALDGLESLLLLKALASIYGYVSEPERRAVIINLDDSGSILGRSGALFVP